MDGAPTTEVSASSHAISFPASDAELAQLLVDLHHHVARKRSRPPLSSHRNKKKLCFESMHLCTVGVLTPWVSQNCRVRPGAVSRVAGSPIDPGLCRPRECPTPVARTRRAAARTARRNAEPRRISCNGQSTRSCGGLMKPRIKRARSYFSFSQQGHAMPPRAARWNAALVHCFGAG